MRPALEICWIRSKYRFYRNDVPGGVFHAAVMVGAEFPTGASDLGSEATDVFAGLSGAFEGRRWLVFATGRYRVNTNGSSDIKRGNVFLYDAAVGLRPVKTGYYQPDLVLMAELNGQVFAERKAQGRAVEGSSGDQSAGRVRCLVHISQLGLQAWYSGPDV